MSKDRCPKCGSTNLMIGNFPLSCMDCDWNHLNKNPCVVCGEPSTGCVGRRGEVIHHCSEHGPTEEQMAGMLADFLEGL